MMPSPAHRVLANKGPCPASLFYSKEVFLVLCRVFFGFLQSICPLHLVHLRSNTCFHLCFQHLLVTICVFNTSNYHFVFFVFLLFSLYFLALLFLYWCFNGVEFSFFLFSYKDYFYSRLGWRLGEHNLLVCMLVIGRMTRRMTLIWQWHWSI